MLGCTTGWPLTHLRTSILRRLRLSPPLGLRHDCRTLPKRVRPPAKPVIGRHCGGGLAVGVGVGGRALIGRRPQVNPMYRLARRSLCGRPARCCYNVAQQPVLIAVAIVTVRIILSAAIALFAATVAIACANAADRSDAGAATLTVFAAASLAESFRAVAVAFEADNPGVTVAFNFAGSQTLRTQLEHGAAAGVFAAADWRQMAAVKEAGLLGSTPVYFAANRLAVATPAGSGTVQTLSDLARPGVSIAIAAAAVPAGTYARNTLQLLAADARFPDDFAAAALANVVTNETSVRGVAQKVALGEVDAGIVYETDVAATQYAKSMRVIEIPLQFNPAAQYPIASLAAAPRPAAALAFIEFVQSDDGQAILREYGFAPPATLPARARGGPFLH